MIPICIAILLVIVALGIINNAYIPLIALAPLILYLIWAWYDTYYVINGKLLNYKSAFLKGTIDISKIIKVERHSGLYAGLKPSLSAKGLIINYNKWDDIYLSPADLDQFIGALKAVNPQINVID